MCGSDTSKKLTTPVWGQCLLNNTDGLLKLATAETSPDVQIVFLLLKETTIEI